MRRDAEFYREIKLKELYPRMTLTGSTKVGNRDAYVIEALPADGSAQKMYFDAQTGLLVRRDEEVETPTGAMPLEIYFEDYREVDGVKLPFTLIRSNPSGRTTIKVTEVKDNATIDDAKFMQPTSKLQNSR
jgi:outer membrane lipoprotein-sorting protein